MRSAGGSSFGRHRQVRGRVAGVERAHVQPRRQAVGRGTVVAEARQQVRRLQRAEVAQRAQAEPPPHVDEVRPVEQEADGVDGVRGQERRAGRRGDHQGVDAAAVRDRRGEHRGERAVGDPDAHLRHRAHLGHRADGHPRHAARQRVVTTEVKLAGPRVAKANVPGCETSTPGVMASRAP